MTTPSDFKKYIFDIFEIKNVHTTILAITYRTFPSFANINDFFFKKPNVSFGHVCCKHYLIQFHAE